MFSCYEALRYSANMSVSKLCDSIGDGLGALEELTLGQCIPLQIHQLPIVASLMANKNGFVWQTAGGAFRGY